MIEVVLAGMGVCTDAQRRLARAAVVSYVDSFVERAAHTLRRAAHEQLALAVRQSGRGWVDCTAGDIAALEERDRS